MTTIAEAISRELNAVAARLTLLGKAIVRVGQSAARTEGHVEQLRESNHKIANATAKLVDVPDLLVEIRDRLDRLEGGCIDAINRVGGALYQTRTELGLPPLKPPPAEPPSELTRPG